MQRNIRSILEIDAKNIDTKRYFSIGFKRDI